jgi:molybdopterin-guanine dinucleotide biosynthesis protein A
MARGEHMSEARIGGIVLCGGRSTRMGQPKATLPFGPELMLQRVVRLLSGKVEPIVVVAAADQPLPPLPGNVIVTRDERSGRGPLEGLFAGLTAIRPHADAAYATSCDVPLLKPEFVRRMIELLGEYEIAVPKEDRFHHPLAAVYRTSVIERIASLLSADRLRPFFLFELAKTLEVPTETLREVDPGLQSLVNLNEPKDYFAALIEAGFSL